MQDSFRRRQVRSLCVSASGIVTMTRVQAQAVREHLQVRKTEYSEAVHRWWVAFKHYSEAVKLDHLRMQFLLDAGVGAVEPQVLLCMCSLV